MKIFLQYGSQSNLYFLSWYGFTLNNNPEKIKEYPIDLEENNLNIKDKKSAQIKLNKDLDLYPVIIELSAHMQIDDFINGFYCFSDASFFKNNQIQFMKEDSRKELVDKLKLVFNKLKILINERIDAYCNETINKDVELFEKGVREKNFNLINVFNVIIEEKKVFFLLCSLNLDTAKLFEFDK